MKMLKTTEQTLFYLLIFIFLGLVILHFSVYSLPPSCLLANSSSYSPISVSTHILSHFFRILDIILLFSDTLCLKAPSHLTECRQTKGDEWEKCTKCTRIQRIQTEFPSNHAISNYCQILLTNDKRRINIKCEGYRLFGSLL